MYIGIVRVNTKRKNKSKQVKSIEITEKDLVKFGICLGLFLAPTGKVFAQEKTGTITEQLQPLIEVLQDLAEPVAYGFMIKGFLQRMAGNVHQGTKTIKDAIAGYLGIQFIPQIFAIIKSIKIN